MMNLFHCINLKKNGKFHYNTNSYSLGWLNEGIVGYVF